MKRWQFWLGLLISAVFLYLALRGLDLTQFWSVVKTANYIWLLPGVGVYLIGVWVRAWRWHYLLRPIKSIPTAKMFPIVAIGYMGNNIFPARIGEVLRAFVLKRRQAVPISASLATIIIERVFDGVVMLGFVFLNLSELTNLTSNSGFIGSIRSLALWGSALFIGVLVIFLLAAMFPMYASSISKSLVHKLLPSKYQHRVLSILERFLSGLAALRKPQEALMIFFSSVIIWLLETGKYWFVMQAFDFEVSFFTLMLMNGIVNLATTIPSAPGYVGTFDAPGIAVLEASGVAKSIAAGYTLVLHVALWLPITLIGFLYFIPEWKYWKNRNQTAAETNLTQEESSAEIEEKVEHEHEQ